MQRVDKGLILRETPYKDADVMLTVLTECQGKLSVLARGVRRKGSRMSAAVQLLTYSEFTLYENGSRFTLNEAEPIEMFYGIRDDIAKLSLASYFAEVLDEAADSESINPELLRLGLNTLYALAKTDMSLKHIKAVFELRAAVLSGYAPELSVCRTCGCADNITCFDVQNGGISCAVCAAPGSVKIDGGVLDAMRHICTADIKRVFSFSTGEESLKKLSLICEEYLRVHFERSFRTLSFYKNIAGDL